MTSSPYFNRFAAVLAGAAILPGATAFAADITFNAVQSSTSMVNGANYIGGVVPGANDTAIFSTQALADNGNPLTANKTMNVVNGNKALGSITFDYGTSADFSWGIGISGSLSLTAGGTIQTIGNQTAALVTTISRPITFGGNYTLASDTTSGGTGQSNLVLNGALTFSSAAPSVLTVKGSAGSAEVVVGATGTSLVNRAGGFVNSVISDGGVNAAVSVVKEGAGVWQLAGVNTYTGGTTIKQGSIVASSSSSLGTGAVVLGDNGVGQNATIAINSNVNLANAITVAAGPGQRILGTNAQSNTATFSGAITMSSGSKLRLQNQSANQNLVISGGITGAGNVEVYHSNANATTTGVVFSSAAINNVGTLTNASPGSGTLTQAAGGVIGSNVTEFIQNSSSSVTTLSLANSYGTTRILIGTLATTGTGTLGTGDVIIENGSLILGSSISLSDTAILQFLASSSTITLNNLNSDVLGGIVDLETSLSIEEGTWTAADLNLFFGANIFDGDGKLTVAAVPEPTVVGLALFAFGFMAVLHLRRRSQAAR